RGPSRRHAAARPAGRGTPGSPARSDPHPRWRTGRPAQSPAAPSRARRRHHDRPPGPGRRPGRAGWPGSAPWWSCPRRSAPATRRRSRGRPPDPPRPAPACHRTASPAAPPRWPARRWKVTGCAWPAPAWLAPRSSPFPPGLTLPSGILSSYTCVKAKLSLTHVSNLREPVTDRSAQPQARRRRQRSEARHSIAAILQAATQTLNADPRASVEDIARAAGVSRQTVYAHFPTREALLDAVMERATAEVTAAFDTAGLDEAPPAVALVRLLDAGWQVTARYPFVSHLPPATPAHHATPPPPPLRPPPAAVRCGSSSGGARTGRPWRPPCPPAGC